MPVEKITMSVKVGLTEREFLDLNRACDQADRTPSEYFRIHLLRPHLYGILRRTAEEGEQKDSELAGL